MFTDPCRAPSRAATQLVDVARREVGERFGLEVGPPELDGVEFRCVRGKKDEAQSSDGANCRTLGYSLVGTELIPDQGLHSGADPTPAGSNHRRPSS